MLDYWLGIPLLNLLATFRRRRGYPPQISRVGVMCSPALGDTLLFSGALRDLRRHFGDGVEIVHFCMKTNLAAAELLEGANRLIEIDLTDPRKTIRQMRAERLDVTFDFSSWQRLTAIYTMLSGAAFGAGFETPGMHRCRGYDVTALHRDDLHETEIFRELLRTLHIPAGSEPRVRVPTEGLEPLSDVKDSVVFHLWPSGQRSRLREWPEERWLELACRLAQPGTTFAITGAPSELPRTETFVAKMRERGLQARAFVGEDGFRSLARLLRRARVVVSVNTGVMHLAAIVGAPTVSINGPNRNGRWGPIGPRGLGVEAPGGGCGYLHLGFNFEGQATDCMERISVDDVLAAVELVAATPVGAR